jgi:hypothetical protein
LNSAPVTGSLSVPLRNWLVVHPVTKADTQQSTATAATLLKVIPKIRFVIRHSRGVAVEEVKWSYHWHCKLLAGKFYTRHYSAR